MPTVAILGAAGRIGGAASKAFVEAGWTVRGVARGAKADALAAGVEPVRADAFDRSALIAACDGADVIVHAINPPYDKWRDTVMPLGETVVAAAEATGATVMIPGNVYNYGTGVSVDMDETMTARPDTEKGRIRVQLEALFADAAAARGVRTIVIRAGDFFGGTAPGSWFDLIILKDLKKNRFVWPGPWDCVHALAYMPDLAETFVRVADKRAELDPFATLHFRGHAVTGNQVHKAAETAAGRPLKRGSVPWPLFRLVGVVNPVVREVARMAYLWRVPHWLDNGRLTALIGKEPHTALDEAIREAVSDLQLDPRR
ncbi:MULTISPECIES: NmrA family NAD(P)-binding protein [unclassified Roseitalea]|uniref:NmrA family NAD(P)-binding protein n=1 Tax=unclassified Roseitalea TaxID=2639107 RepID=UPI00273DEB8A|nr:MULTISPECIES: NmrA family NAD(P)-binding protein [unclassified Roseitalea]